jgi:hypothetical protein
MARTVDAIANEYPFTPLTAKERVALTAGATFVAGIMVTAKAVAAAKAVASGEVSIKTLVRERKENKQSALSREDGGRIANAMVWNNVASKALHGLLWKLAELTTKADDGSLTIDADTLVTHALTGFETDAYWQGPIVSGWAFPADTVGETPTPEGVTRIAARVVLEQAKAEGPIRLALRHATIDLSATGNGKLSAKRVQLENHGPGLSS